MGDKPTKPGKPNKMTTGTPQPSSHEDFIMELERKFQDINDYLDGLDLSQIPTLGHVKMRIKQHVFQDITWLSTLLGGTPAIRSAEAGKNPLVHNVHGGEKRIMGVLVGDQRKAVTEASINPEKAEMATFANDVDNLYKGFLGMKDREIEELVAKGGDTLIRGVAKRAGVEGWEEADMDNMFFADIKAAIKGTLEQGSDNGGSPLDEE